MNHSMQYDQPIYTAQITTLPHTGRHLFERLKQHDPEWLAATLNERWNQISGSSKNGTHNTVEAPERRPVLGHKRRSQHSIDWRNLIGLTI
jgi:hypothetical protein